MPSVLPPAGFAHADLHLHIVPLAQKFGRIYSTRYPDPLSFGKTRSRFSDPRRRREASRFGVLYLGETVKVCFLEAVLRDQRDGMIGELWLAESEIHIRHFAEIETTAPLRMVDLREDGAVIMGVPSDVAKARKHSLSRAWSVAFHDHPQKPDGIIYPSRLNGHINLAVYDHAITKLRTVRATRLIGAPGLAAVLNELHVGLTGPVIPQT